jgi:hypothetical protein
VADEVVEVVDAVGFEAHVSAPAALTPPEFAKQKVIEVFAPFAATVPFRVADVAPIEEAFSVVAPGSPALIVKARVLSAEVEVLSVTLKVKLVAEAVVVGVPLMTPVLVLSESPSGSEPEIRLQEE